jgi:hypothetical protein
MPHEGPIPYGETVSLSNWDIFWYTRGFPSVDTERARRHLSKLLTYPMTVAGALHEYSGLTTRNQRVTPEGLRSLAGKVERHCIEPISLTAQQLCARLFMSRWEHQNHMDLHRIVLHFDYLY